MSNNAIRLAGGLKDSKLLTIKELCQIYGFNEWGVGWVKWLLRIRKIP